MGRPHSEGGGTHPTTHRSMLPSLPPAPQDLEAETEAGNWALPPMPMLVLWTPDQAPTCPTPQPHQSPSHRCGMDQSPRLWGYQDKRCSDGAGLGASGLQPLKGPGPHPVDGPAGLLSSQHWLSEPAAVGFQLHCPAQPLKLCDCSSQEWLLQTVINKHVPN